MKCNSLIAILLVLGIPVSKAQFPGKECLKKVRQYAQKINQMDFPEDNEVYFIHYAQEVVMWDSLHYPTTRADVKLLMSKDQIHTITDEIEMYQDVRDAFLIIHSKKMVIWNSSTIRADKEKKLKELAGLSDTLFDLCRIKICQKVPVKNREMGQLLMIPEEELKASLNVRSLNLLYEPEDGRIQKVEVEYTPDFDYQKTITTYKTIDFNYKAKMNKPVMARILNKKQELLPAYQGYQLVDNR